LEADWLIGMNGMPAVTTTRLSVISQRVTTVGRIQSLTLATIVNRGIEICFFKMTKFWEVVESFRIYRGLDDDIPQKIKN
jgi:DNA topoisomerase IA